MDGGAEDRQRPDGGNYGQLHDDAAEPCGHGAAQMRDDAAEPRGHDDARRHDGDDAVGETCATRLEGPWALLVAGSPEGIGADALRELAAAAAFVVAADSGADRLHAAGIVPDLLVGDMDSINPKTLADADTERTRMVRVSPVKDESDLALALAEIGRAGFSAVVVTHALGGRLDHTLAVLGVLASAQALSIEVIDTGERIRFIGIGSVSEVRLSDLGLCPDDVFSVFALDAGARMSAVGVAYPVVDLPLAPFSDRGLSNVVVTTDASVRASAGRLMIVAERVLSPW